jgi:hypothetical protein
MGEIVEDGEVEGEAIAVGADTFVVGKKKRVSDR